MAVAVGHAPTWEDARDAAQEAFAAAFVHLDGLRDPAAFPGWLAALVRSACSRRTRRRQHPTGSLDGIDPAVPSEGDPAVQVAERDERQRVRAAIEALAEPLRTVVALHYLAGLSYPQVGDFLGIGQSAAKKRAWTARRQLEELLPMTAKTLRNARPSRTRRFSDTILLFTAIRRGDHATLTDLIATNPGLVDVVEDWPVSEALDAGLLYAGKASPLIRAAQTGDLAMVKFLVEAGAKLDTACGCAGAETALWAATTAGAADVVAYLLNAGADPDTAAFAGATPLHVAAQRRQNHISRLLLAAGADPNLADDHGRTPGDWATRARPEQAPENDERLMVPTGIRAVDLFAPLRRGGLQYWPPAYGLGQFVLLFEIARALSPARCWFVGFANGPYDHDGICQEIRETGVDATVALTPAGSDPTGRRAHFAGTLALLEAERQDKVVVCLEAPGHAHDVTVALPALASNATVITTIVVSPFTGSYPQITARVPEGYDSQVAFDPLRASRRMWPAVDPGTTSSIAYPSRHHHDLADAARRLLHGYAAWDADLHLPNPTILPAPDTAATAQALLRYLTQPFHVTEPTTSRSGQSTSTPALLETIQHLVTPPIM